MKNVDDKIRLQEKQALNGHSKRMKPAKRVKGQ